MEAVRSQELGCRQAGQEPDMFLASWPESLLASLVCHQMIVCHPAESHMAIFQFRKNGGEKVLFCVISFISCEGLDR